jgi:hypothetical protein
MTKKSFIALAFVVLFKVSCYETKTTGTNSIQHFLRNIRRFLRNIKCQLRQKKLYNTRFWLSKHIQGKVMISVSYNFEYLLEFFSHKNLADAKYS